MSAWACYVAFVKKYLNSRWSKSASKEIYLTSIANSAKRKKDVSEENVPCATGEEQPNRFSRRSIKFAVRVMLFDNASNNVPDKILLLVEFIFPWGKMCKFSTLCDRLFSLSVFLLNMLSVLCGTSAQNHVEVSDNHFPWFFSTAVIFVLACKQRFLSCMHGF